MSKQLESVIAMSLGVLVGAALWIICFGITIHVR